MSLRSRNKVKYFQQRRESSLKCQSILFLCIFHCILSAGSFQNMSSKRKSHPMKILSDSQLYPSSKPLFSPPSSHVFPNFPIIAPASFLPAPKENDETEEMTETKTDQEEAAESAEDASEMTNTKSNNDANVPAHREAMNQILKKLALKSQENLRKSKEENCRQVD